MAASVDFTIAFDNLDEAGWIVARVLEVPGAVSQGRTREEARENALDALQTVLTPDEELAGHDTMRSSPYEVSNSVSPSVSSR
jgi:predicted RNase H-like HicB family nuclease